MTAALSSTSSDFIDMKSDPARKWLIATHLSVAELANFTKAMNTQQLFDTFHLKTKLFPSKQRYQLLFRLQDGTSQFDFCQTRKLTRLIFDYTAPIYWKEDNMGYEINEYGKIMRRWALGT